MPEETATKALVLNRTFTNFGAAKVHMCPNCKLRETPPPRITDAETEKLQRGLPKF